MTKICLISDIHLSDRPPSSCTDTYTDDLFDLLEQARVMCAEQGMPMVWAGDTFHHKAPSRVSYRLVHRACRFIEQCVRNFPVLILGGNHDFANDRVESVHETQPLGMLYRAGATELNGWGSPFRVFGVPWLQGYGNYAEQGNEIDPLQPLLDIEVRVGEALRPFRESRIRDQYLVVTHAPLYPPGRELAYEYFPAERWAEAMGMKGSVFYGHVHEPHGEYGFYDAEGGVTFCNNGALSRGSLHEYNLTRDVGVTLWDDRTGRFEFVPLRARPASEVFRLQEKQQVVDMAGRLDDFLASAGEATLEVLNVESVIAHVRTLGLGKPLEDLVEELLNG